MIDIKSSNETIVKMRKTLKNKGYSYNFII